MIKPKSTFGYTLLDLKNSLDLKKFKIKTVFMLRKVVDFSKKVTDVLDSFLP